MASETTIDDCLAVLSAMYPKYFREMDERTAGMVNALYHRTLKDVDDVLLNAAVDQWVSDPHPYSTTNGFPLPGDLRDLELRLVTRDEPGADEAWAEVQDAIKHIGSYGVPIWSSNRIAKTVEALGWWKDLCATEYDQLPFVRAQFMKIYEAMHKREHDDRLTLPEVRDAISQIAGKRLPALASRAESSGEAGA